MPISLDSIDRQIIALLVRDGRASAATLSRALGDVSERTVRYRIERLLRGDVMRVSAVVSPQALGYRIIADVFIEVAAGQVGEVARRLAECEHVSYVAASIGESDLSIQVCARDEGELAHIVGDVVGPIPGVRRTRTVLVPWKLKDVYEWQIPPALADVT